MKQNKNTISKWSLCLLFIIASFLLVREKIYASSIPLGGEYNGDKFSINCSLLTNEYPDSIGIAGSLGSTTPDWAGGLSGYSIGWSEQDFQDACAGSMSASYMEYGYLSFPDVSVVMLGQPSGTYYWAFTLKETGENYGDRDIYYLEYEWNGTIVTSYSKSYESTYFIDLTPKGGSTISSSSPTNWLISFNITDADWIENSYLRIKYVRQQTLQSAVANTDLLWTNLDFAPLTGLGGINEHFYYEATTTDALGNDGVYLIKLELRKPSTFWTSALSWFNPFTSHDPDIIVASSSQFTYGEMTTFDTYVASSTASFNDFLASSTTSLAQVKEACNPISGFDLTICLSGLFIPSNGDINNAVSQFKENVATHFPLGYFSDFITIISTTTTGTISIIDAELPTALGLGNANIKLDLAHQLDDILNATTSQFSNSSSTGASSTATFFETTNYYWSIIVYVLTLFYILGRLINSAIIPRKI